MSATSIATAYVEIVPTTKGAKDKITEALGGEKTGEEAGKTTGKGILSGISSMLTQYGTQLIQEALNESASLEQSIGGIETLFKDSADKMLEYADEAYKTAGVSANDYMELATSFAASLLQGTAGDTELAADAANQAIIDMADNANKMGTDMSSIQNAYMGFAKQNYTMLDNLKLGYGGTKTEMERLLADAQELTGIEYDIDNLADVYSAIHVIQEDLGITGTTAEEAAETMSGSFASMKAAAQNLLGYLGTGENITEPLKALVETASTWLMDNIVPAVMNVVTAIPEMISVFFVETFPTLLDDVVSMITGAIPTLITTAITLVTALGEGLVDSLPLIVEAGVEGITALVTGLVNNLPTLIETALEIIMALADGLIDALPKLIDAATEMIPCIITTLVENLPKLIVFGIELVTKLATAIITNLPKALVGLFKALKDAFTSIDWKSLGKGIIDGIVNGVKNAASALWQAMKDLASDALATAKKVLGIASPSKKFKNEVGKMIGLGMAEGIVNSAKAVSESMQTLTDATVTPFNTSVGIRGRVSNKTTGDIVNGLAPLLSNRGAETIQLVCDGKTLAQVVYDPMSGITTERNIQYGY